MYVICIDLNDLKNINDSDGHNAGDEALYTIANIFVHNSRKTCSVYRTGGDEFALLCQNCTIDDVIKYINKVKKDLSKTKYSAAFGYALYTPDKDFDEVFELADAEMYRNKQECKNLA